MKTIDKLDVRLRLFCGVVNAARRFACKFAAMAAVSMLALIAGCAMHETYGDHTLAGSELAVVEGYWRYLLLYDEELHIVSVDGTREGGRSGWPYAYSVSLPSGKHWLQIAILRNSREIVMCAFEWTFEAQHRYKLRRLHHDQSLLAHPSSPVFAASISITDAAHAQSTQHLRAPAVCGTEHMCRQSSECPANYSCQSNAGLDFGTCKSPGR